MLNPEEVISYYKELKEEVSKIADPEEKQRAIERGLNKYSLEEWCEVGDILLRAKIILNERRDNNVSL